MALQLLDLVKLQKLTLDSGEIADSLSVHALGPKLRKMGVEIPNGLGKQDMLQRLSDFRDEQQAADRKRPYNSGEAIIAAVQAKGAS